MLILWYLCRGGWGNRCRRTDCKQHTIKSKIGACLFKFSLLLLLSKEAFEEERVQWQLSLKSMKLSWSSSVNQPNSHHYRKGKHHHQQQHDNVLPLMNVSCFLCNKESPFFNVISNCHQSSMTVDVHVEIQTVSQSPLSLYLSLFRIIKKFAARIQSGLAFVSNM